MVLKTKIRQFSIRKAECQPEFEPPGSITISVADDDELDDDDFDQERVAEQQIDEDNLGYAEGQSFLIEYVDSKGNQSTRRITVWGIKEGAGNCSVLVAKCHERNATRTFRVDRIQSVIDYDGVVHEPLEDFLVETFGMRRELICKAISPRSGASVSSSKTPSVLSKDQRWNAIRQICRTRGVPLLCVIARSDGEFHPNELQVIRNYAARCCALESLDLTEDEAENLMGYLRRLRPSTTAIGRCLDQANKWSNREILGLLETCAYVVKADGDVDKKELDELGLIVQSLTGRAL